MRLLKSEILCGTIIRMKNFDFQFTSEEDIQHLLDGFVEGMQDMVAEDEGKTTIINPLRLAQIKFTYSVMKYLTRDTDAEVTYKLNEPFKTMGSVSVEGKVLEFAGSKWFARAAEFASNTEVYPLAKNRIRLTFTFHGLTAPIE